jgi:uncharacterized protein (DUF2267 family)
MTDATIPSFSHAAQQAQQWVNELAAELGWSNQRAYHLLKAVLTALRDWLSPEESADLSAQLPMLIRSIYFEGWDPALSPATERKKRDFVIRVERGFGYDTNVDLDEAIHAVFKLIDRHISHGESLQVRNSMKKTLRQLWPAH